MSDRCVIHYQSINTTFRRPHANPWREVVFQRKSLRLKNLRINLWGSRICRDFLSKLLIPGKAWRGIGYQLGNRQSRIGKAADCERQLVNG